MKGRIIFAALFMVALLCSCNQFSKEELIAEDNLVKVLIDVHMADGTLTAQGFKVKSDSIVLQKYYDYIFLKHNTTPAIFQKTLKYYTKHPAELDRIYTKVIEQLTLIESQIQEKESDSERD